MSKALKIRRVTTEEWDIPDFVERLKSALQQTRKPVSQICESAGVSTTVWYQMMRGEKQSIDYEKAVGLCQELGVEIPEVVPDDAQ